MWRALRAVGAAHRRPLVSVVFAFALSRGITYALGVRFNAHPVECFRQFVDPELLRSRLLESLFYLHGQPPLFNAMVGTALKLFPGHFGAAMHAVYLTLGLALSLGLYVLLVRVGIRPWPSAGLGSALTASPAFLLYENWLFYEYPVATLLVLSALALHRFLDRGSAWAGVAFFLWLAAIIYIRTTFQVVWLLLVAALLLAVRPELRRRVLAASLVPTLLVALLLVKNAFVFGVPTTSSWFGMYLAELVDRKVLVAERQKLVARGELSRVSLAPPFVDPVTYRRLVAPPRPRGIPLLDELKNSAGCWNMNNSVYIPASRDYFSDSLTLIRLRPGGYASAILADEPWYVRPATEAAYFDGSTIHRYDTAFDRVILPQFRDGRPAWTILLALITALGYGLWLTYRLVKRRIAATASAVTVAYVWLTIAYVTVAVTFTQVGEKNRIRFLLDPFLVVLVAAAVSDIAPRIRRTLRARR
jgi:hypothetical protein